MPKFGTKSLNELSTADPRLQNLFRVVIQHIDCSILFGSRSPELQFTLFKKGRQLNPVGEWVIIDKSKVVTYKDGFNKKSKHNHNPSKAVDAVSYPIDWKDTDQAYYFAGIVKGIAYMMGINIRWGGDFNRNNQVQDESFRDLFHFEIID